MYTYKKWFFLTILFVLIIIPINFVLWETKTKYFFEKGGDLSRLGYVFGALQERPNAAKLTKKHLESAEYNGQKIDVLTIGDSFSNGGGGDKNKYQDYIASIHNLEVLNIQPYPHKTGIETIIILFNSGYLEKINPKYIIIEDAEKTVINRYNKKIDFTEKTTLSNIEEYYKKKQYKNAPPSYIFMNSGNINYVLYTLFYKISDHAFFSKTYIAKLDRPLFSAHENSKLLFYVDDIKNIKLVNTDSILVVNENFNTLAEQLKQKNIKLYFMPAVDKYDLYYNFISNHKYPKNIFFDELRKLKKNYILIDTKNILLPKLYNDEQDIYYADDTHWSEKGFKNVVENIKFGSM